MRQHTISKNSPKNPIVRLAVILLSLSLLLPLAACSDTKADNQVANGQYRYRAQFLGVFDTVTTVIGLADSEEQFQEYIELLKSELTYYHQLFDIYTDYEGVNNLKTINNQAGIEAVKVDEPIIALLELTSQANELSGGRVNSALGAVLKIWHRYRDAGLDHPEEAELPPLDRLEEAGRHTDISLLQIDPEAQTVYLADQEMSLDVGSGAKGFATERAAQTVKEAGLENALISVGGNIKALGFRNGIDEAWNVGIRDPNSEDSSAYIKKVHATDMAVVTSGVYERFYVVDGERYHHIIDPRTLMPEYNFDSVTIVCPDSGLADSLTTALFNMTLDEGKAMLAQVQDAEALWIKGDEIVWTDGMQQYLFD